MIFSVIMAGGKGERFWPLSTTANPKQLLSISSDKTMLQETIDRVRDFIPLDQTVIVAGEHLRERILSRHSFISEKNLLVEPFGRNTCLAIAFAAVHLQKQDPEGVMIVLSADHYIQPREKTVAILKTGAEWALKEDVLITIGISPTRPETGYGYIELGELHDSLQGISAYDVKKFKEKPDRKLAQEYFFDRSHLWNSGMFIWSIKAILKSIRLHHPKMYELLMEYAEQIGTDDELKARRHLFEVAENISIDFAILERADNVLVIKGELIWDDIGSWLALERISAKDKDGNVRVGDSHLYDSYEVTAVNKEDGIVCTLGVSDLVVVRTKSVVLVAHKTRVGDIKEMLKQFGDAEDFKQYL